MNRLTPWGLALTVLAWSLPAFAHPGRTDACKGHMVTEVTRYEKAQPTERHLVNDEKLVDEPGEYHFHLGDACMQIAWNTPLGGAFDCEGVHYELMPVTTRDHYTILTCVEPDGTRHTGTARGRK